MYLEESHVLGQEEEDDDDSKSYIHHIKQEEPEGQMYEEEYIQVPVSLAHHHQLMAQPHHLIQIPDSTTHHTSMVIIEKMFLIRGKSMTISYLFYFYKKILFSVTLFLFCFDFLFIRY